MIREMEIKTIMRYPLTAIRMAIVKKQTNRNNNNKELEKLEPLCTVGGNVKWCSHYRKKCKFLRNLKIELLYYLAIPLLDIYPKESKAGS